MNYLLDPEVFFPCFLALVLLVVVLNGPKPPSGPPPTRADGEYGGGIRRQDFLGY